MNEKYDIEQIQFFGGVDTDTDPDFLEKGDFLYALNIVNNSGGKGNKGKVKMVDGNTQIAFPQPLGINKCIGVAEDTENERFVFFNWNSLGRHGIYKYDALGAKVTPLLINIDDTAGIDILRFDKDSLILHADIVRKNLLYWVDGKSNARKTNIAKLLDKTTSGYGDVILQSYIDAYKQTTVFPPTASYFSDPSKKFNRLYGALRRFAVRFIYDDGEKSNWSDFSAIALPDYESFAGIENIPSKNNGIKISFETGSMLVEKIEIAMQATSAEQNNDGILDWTLIAALNKKDLHIGDNTTGVYKFYNDGIYPVTPYHKIIRPYNFLPEKPRCQTFVKNKLVYSNFYEGFEKVKLDVETAVNYQRLFIPAAVENKFNKPFFQVSVIPSTDGYLENDYYINLDGTPGRAMRPRRTRAFEATIGADVKQRNYFKFRLYTENRNFEWDYRASRMDTAATVANFFITLLKNTGVIIKRSSEGPVYNIDDTKTDGDGNVKFCFIAMAEKIHDGSAQFLAEASVNPTQYNTMKDTGESRRNIKLGSSVKYGLTYEDFDGRKSPVYTDERLLVCFKSLNEFPKRGDEIEMQAPSVDIIIKHRPPPWAKYYQITRSNDLIYGRYIQLLAQKAITLKGDGNNEYMDLVVGSLTTYNKIHPNSNLSYAFSKGDRVRLLKRIDTATNKEEVFEFFETEILNYYSVVDEKITSNIVTDGSAVVEVASASDDNVGRYIVIEGNERLITKQNSGASYILDSPIGDKTRKVFLSYHLVDRRGVIRIRKPKLTGVDIINREVKGDLVIEYVFLIEIFSPAVSDNSLMDKQFYEFQQKFPIINAGQPEAFHGGNKQNQNQSLAAIVTIEQGTAYVRNRELPVTNNYPGAQTVISCIEDPSFSDFYPSLINDNGRTNIEDAGMGKVHFGDRMRFSNNSIEETKLNGLGDFDNLDREDYTDKYGEIVRTVFFNNNILTFKKLRTCYVPVDAKLSADDAGTTLRVGSSKFLNPIQYFAWEGGLGNNPEAYCSDGTSRYFASANSGALIRLAANGEEPISKTFKTDKLFKELLYKASVNKAKIFLGYNRLLSLLCVTIEDYQEYIYDDGFNGWTAVKETFPATSPLKIVTPPPNGKAFINSDNLIEYIPNTGFIGEDSFSYSAFHNGKWTEPEKVCLHIKEKPYRQTLWRPKASAATCQIKDKKQTGYVIYATLEQYYPDDGTPTGKEKPNVAGGDDYVAPIYDTSICPANTDIVVSIYATYDYIYGFYFYVSLSNSVREAVKISFTCHFLYYGAPDRINTDITVPAGEIAASKEYEYLEGKHGINPKKFGDYPRISIIGVTITNAVPNPVEGRRLIWEKKSDQ